MLHAHEELAWFRIGFAADPHDRSAVLGSRFGAKHNTCWLAWLNPRLHRLIDPGADPNFLERNKVEDGLFVLRWLN
jgi:hypothetical protein